MYRNLSMEDICGEIWKPVVGYESDYMVSNYGRVKSIFKEIVDVKGRRRPHKQKILRQAFTSTGYLFVNLRGKPNKVHRIVGYAFIPLREGATEINHKDCNPLNNRVENLEWCTQKENIDHAILNKRNKKYTYVDKEKVIELYKQGRTAREIGEMMSVNRGVVVNIARKNNLFRKDYRRKSKYIDLYLLKSLFESGMTNKEISKKYNIRADYIARRRYQMMKGDI